MQGILFIGMLLFTITTFADSQKPSIRQCIDLFGNARRVNSYARPPASRAFVDKQDLKVMEWNAQDLFVHRPLNDNFDFIQQNPTPGKLVEKPREKILHMQETIRRERPDIIIWGEVIGPQTTRVLDPRNEYNHIADTPRDGRDSHTVFMVRKDLNIDIKLVVPPPIKRSVASLDRGLPYIEIRQKDANGRSDRSKAPDMIIIGVHLKAFRPEIGEAKFAEIKTAEVTAILKLIKHLQELFPESPLMLAGDLNADINVHPALFPLLHQLQDALAYTNNPTSRSSRATRSHIDKWGHVEAQELDVQLLNYILLQRLVSSEVLRSTDENGNPVLYRDEVGNLVPYPTNISARQRLDSDHDPVVSVYNMAEPVGVAPRPIPRYAQKLKDVFYMINQRVSVWTHNDPMHFELNINGDKRRFLDWLQTHQLNSFVQVVADVKNTDRLIVIISYEGLGYLLLKDSANSLPLIKDVRFQSP
jgi:hypothetical protein